MKTTVSAVKNDIHNLFASLKDKSISPSVIDKVFEKCSNPFTNLQTEAQRFAKFKNSTTFIRPENVILGERQQIKEKNGVKIVKSVPVLAQFIPLREVFTKFIELPGVFDKTMEYREKVLRQSETVKNTIQGSLWKKKISEYGDKIVFPLDFGFDDYENNNPLGSHKGIGKCGTVFTNKILFSRVIEIQFLQKKGISISLPSGKKQIYFVLTLIRGDNLGLHSMLGLNENFLSNLFYRLCLTLNENIM